MDALHKQLAQKSLEVESLTEAISKLKLFEPNSTIEFALESKRSCSVKISELEYSYKCLQREKQQLEINYHVLNERFNDIKTKYDDLVKEWEHMDRIGTEKVNDLEVKISKLEGELTVMNKENKTLRLSEERLRLEHNTLLKLKEKYEEKYYKKKELVSNLTARMNEMEREFKEILTSRETEEIIRRSEEDNKKIKTETKNKILEEMNSRIEMYRKEMIRKRMNKETY